jgi:hypothetical protein
MDRQSGAAAVEYAILVGLIAVVILGAVGALGMAIFPAERVDRIVDVLDGKDPAGATDPEPTPTVPGDDPVEGGCRPGQGNPPPGSPGKGPPPC